MLPVCTLVKVQGADDLGALFRANVRQVGYSLIRPAGLRELDLLWDFGLHSHSREALPAPSP